MKKYFGILRECSLFSGIDDSNIIPMLGCLGASLRRFEKKEVILSVGSPANYIGIVLTGSVQIIQIDYFGNRSIVASILPSELFGETFACSSAGVMSVDVIANEACDIMFIDCQKVLKSCSNACSFHQQIIFNLMHILANKNLIFHTKIDIISKRTTREKLMAYLLMEAQKHNSNSFEIPYNRQELADYLGVDRSGLSTELGKLEKERKLVYKRNHFELLLENIDK
ncbi:MAG: Crp/Fnr family transcriptional regulator [Erysipelotrichales bacterium]|nr:Crp/Fnr family transcriptional regulator [Erysipelotrichales bacterium]